MPEINNSDNGLSIKDLILIIYNAKKIFLVWCFIGLFLGIAAAGGYYIFKKTADYTGDVSVEFILNYPGADFDLFPNGADFDADFFLENYIWENALNKISRKDITINEAVCQVVLTKKEPERDNIKNELKQNIYIFNIYSDNQIFKKGSEKKDFLNALCQEYKKFLVNKYYIGETTGMLYGQHLKTWSDSCNTIIWDAFSFDINFKYISSRYLKLAEILDKLYYENAAYKLSDGKSFYDYAQKFREIREKDIASWLSELECKIYIRDVDRFIDESQNKINMMKITRDQCLESVELYNKLLVSFQNANIPEVIYILAKSRRQSDIAADLNYKINKTEYELEMLELNEEIIRENSINAESALEVFIKELEAEQENLRKAIYDYYEQKNKRAAENYILFADVTPILKISVTKLLLIFFTPAFAGFVFGLFAAFVKKYIPDRKKRIKKAVPQRTAIENITNNNPKPK